MADESQFWADQIVQSVLERVDKEPKLKEITKKRGFICYDEKTPSGNIHIGSGRGWVIHDTVAKAMRDAGLKGRFILSSDDIDPFDKFPSYLDKNTYEPYLGMPFRDIPSPEKGYKNYADYYFMECVEKFGEFGIEAEIESTGERYDNGDFNETIKTALDNADKIQQIYARISGEDSAGARKLPFNPICEKCGKIGTTEAYGWDAGREVIKYRCREDLVPWAKGCGHEGERSPYDGGGKFPWKVEWAAKWPTVGVSYEVAGKDHFTEGGSRTIAVAISNEVFDFPPPYPSTRTETGRGYEFFTVGGKKMSTSKGKGIGFRAISEHVPPMILRYLLVRTRPRAVIDFDPYQTNKLILLYDNYDRTERVYFGAEKVENERDEKQEKRIYKLSHVGKMLGKLPPQVSLTHAAMLVQSTNFDSEGAMEILRETKHIPEKLSKEELAYVRERLESATKWVKEFAPEQYKFTVLEKLPADIKLDDEQKAVLGEIADIFEKRSWTEKELEKAIYELAKEKSTPKKTFQAAYLALLGKERGPRLAAFMLSLSKELVVKRFRGAG